MARVTRDETWTARVGETGMIIRIDRTDDGTFTADLLAPDGTVLETMAGADKATIALRDALIAAEARQKPPDPRRR